MLWTLYVHCALKICNEAVVEGFGSVVQRHATGVRGLCFNVYARESRVAYNAPHPAKSDSLIAEALQDYFDQKNYVHKNNISQCFHRKDSNRYRLPTRAISTMLHRMINRDPVGNPIRLEFME